MSYEGLWKVLEDLLTELQERGETIPLEIIGDLRSAKTLIQILKADPTHTETLPEIEAYLESVEAYIVFSMKEKIGPQYADKSMKKIGEARRRFPKEGEETQALRFAPGLPRDHPWIRIQVSKETPRKEIEQLAEEKGLAYKTQDNEYIVLYGDGEKIKSLVKKLAERLRGEKGK
jgi:hypothetical protein